ncbi:MAG: glycosyltransferase family 4 protein, partial [Methylocystis sp.]
MRIVIDVQGAQTESRTRGIGRYTLSFVDALVGHRGNHDIILALNGLFPETIEPIRAHFRDMLPRENIRVWYAPGPVRAVEPDNDGRRQAAELIREAFLASLDPDIVYVTSLFEGFGDDAVTSIGAMVPRMFTAVTIYDLIPLRNPDHFLKPNPSLDKWYRRKLDYLKRADLHLAISEATARDARDALSLADDRVVNVSTACSEMFRQRTIPEAEKQVLFSKFGVRGRFVLCSGTIEPHKNLSRLFHAYARLPRALREAYQLLLVGKADEMQKLLLSNMVRDAGIEDGRLIVSGYVSDDDLVALYNLCAVTVVFSYHEEFGLPALEAMSCGAAVIGSNTTSILEVIGGEEALFDPYHEASITAKLAQALTDDPFCTALKAHGLKQVRKFSW